MSNRKMNWYEIDMQSVMETMQVNPDTGLSQDEIRKRQENGGMNVLQPPKKIGLATKILHHLKDVSVIVLLIAVALSFVMAFQGGKGFIEPFAILAVVIMNLILGITQEGKAERALEALEKLSAPDCTVIRDGIRQKIEAAELVPGDIIFLETGNVIPADARLFESTGLFSDESALTGESEPAEKNATAKLSGKIPIGDQFNMVFTGCVITAGRGTAVVTDTGMNTQMGLIAGFLKEGKRAKTPLQKRLDQLGVTICWIAIVSALFLLAIGLQSGTKFGDMMLVAIALAVAAVPEMLSLIVTLTLTNGVQKMVAKSAIIRKLPAVETLGSASVICSDKTGTLTQNRMAVMKLWMRGEEAFNANDIFTQEQVRFLEIFSMAGNAVVQKDENENKTFIGNATEVGILRLLDEKGLSEIAHKDYPRVAEIPFSSDRKKMTVILKDEIKGGYAVLTKGALDWLPLCPESIAADMDKARQIHDQFAENALRIIALAGKRVDKLPENGNWEELEKDIKLMGLVGLIDPPRPEAAISIREAHNAGIHTVMITGDHAVTAEAIAKELGMMQEGKHVMTGARLATMCDAELQDTVKNYTVYARVTPEDKIRIVRAWQNNGEVVAMTGDGVNDAPALKAADIGVAMGKTGTEVAKSASDMILTDDNFSTIVAAIGEGRNVYRIVKMIIFFLLVCNFSEIAIMFFGQLAGWGLVLTPITILLINLLGDGIPGISLAKEQSNPDLMNNSPIRKDESLFGDGLLKLILRQTLFCTVVVLIGYYIGALDKTTGTVIASCKTGQTMAFLICGWTSIIHIFTVRTSKSVFKTCIRNNKSLTMSAVAMIAIFGLIVAFPFGKMFGLVQISGINWIAVGVLSIIPLLLRELCRLIDNIPRVQERRQKMKNFVATKIWK